MEPVEKLKNEKLIARNERKFNTFLNHNDCLCCLWRTYYIIGSMLGMSVLKLSCPHSKKYFSSNSKFEKNAKLGIINNLYIIFLIPAVLMDFAISNENVKTKFNFIDTINTITTDLLTLVSLKVTSQYNVNVNVKANAKFGSIIQAFLYT